MYELIIIGGGPAAMSAAIYAARKKMKTLLVAYNFGGQMMEGYKIDNYLGLPGLLGIDLTQKFMEHLKKFEKNGSDGIFELEAKDGETIKNIKVSENGEFEAYSDKGKYSAKAMIIATGRAERKLNVPGAKEFEGKGISYCATCDAPLFNDKIVAVIGAGDAGQDTAWELTKYAKKVYLLNRYDELRGDDKQLQERLKKEAKVNILAQVDVKEIIGEKFVSAMVYQDLRTGESHKIDVSGIFVEIGSTPASMFLDGLLRCNDKGEIIVEHNSCATSVPGIFAAGDVTDVSEKQIIIAAGMGAKAALSVYNYLKNK
ncbi:MAG: FAD-dependent oxidoreductase [bacterium]